MPETASMTDVENALTEQISMPISLYSKSQPFDELLYKPEKIYLYQLLPEMGNTFQDNSIAFYAYRKINLAIYSCKKCSTERQEPLVKTSFSVRGQLKTVQDVVYTFIKSWSAKEHLYCCKKGRGTQYKLSDLNAKDAQLSTNLVDLPPDSVLSFQLVPLGSPVKCDLM